MAANPDLVTPIALGLAELINAKARTPSLEELRAHLHNAYLAALSKTTVPAETCTKLAESMAAPRAEAVLALINGRPSSPTAEEIRNVLAPPQPQAPEVITYEQDIAETAEKECGCSYDLDTWSVYAHAASAYLPRLQKTRPDLVGPELWREALALAMEAGLSVHPLD